MVFEGFIGPTYIAQNVNVAAERCINLYPEFVQSPASAQKSRLVLYSKPGLLRFSELPKSPVRALFPLNGKLYCVAGDGLYEVYSDGSYLALASGLDPTGPITVSANNNSQLFISGELNGFNYDTNTHVLTRVVDSSFGCFHSSRFFSLVPNTQEFKISGLNNGLSWSDLDFGEAELDPDNAIALLSDAKILWIFGTSSIQPYSDSGDPDIVISPIREGTIQLGCGAAMSVAVMLGNIYFLSTSKESGPVIYKISGFQPVRISNPSIEAIMTLYSRVDDAVGFCYGYNGHQFFQLNFPTQGSSLVWDETTQLWHERGYYNTQSGSYLMDRASCHAYIFGKHLMGDAVNGYIHSHDFRVYTDDGNPIRWLRQAAHFNHEGNWIYYKSLQVSCLSGAGLPSGQGSNPECSLSWSDDGGHVFKSEHPGYSGRQGEFRKRLIWHRLGRSRDRVFRLTGTDPVQTCLIQAYLNIGMDDRDQG